MTIRLLPPQLANQIAAGEVVERPASVVKELVENALDAGATDIHIDIEKGGSRLIRVRDNGCGVAQDELTLALSRHATSKIADFSDLAAIVSLGFRGEALASISSVSRLTLTSKPQSQDNAWQAKAEGRDMAVDVRPAAHPTGTTVEVLDLFFNTPARRRFLKSEKTEFSHIDEFIKRLALSRFDVSWTLTHNGQIVRQLRAVMDDDGKQKRLAAVVGRNFAQQALFVQSQYDDIRLHGWVLPAMHCHTQLICQYSYVNGRMMRDKLLGHAIRQAYSDQLLGEQQPAYVLYVDLPAEEVDVNVHPAKHEVRFHQARLVHDFVASALGQALASENAHCATWQQDVVSPQDPQGTKPALKPDTPSLQGYASKQVQPFSASAKDTKPHSVGEAHLLWPATGPAAIPVAPRAHFASNKAVGNFHSASNPTVPPSPSVGIPLQSDNLQPTPADHLLLAELQHWLWPVNATTALVRFEQQIYLVDLSRSVAQLFAAKPPPSQALLLPVRLNLTAEEIVLLTAHAEQLASMGFDILLSNQALIVRALPQCLVNMPVAMLLQQWWMLWQTPCDITKLWQLLIDLVLTQGVNQLTTILLDLLQQPTYWHAMPLNLADTEQLLKEQL